MSAFVAACPPLSIVALASLMFVSASCAKEAGSQPDVPQPDYGMQGGMQGGALPPPGMPPPGAPPAQSWDGPTKRPRRVRDVVGASATTTATAAPSSTAAPTPTTTAAVAAISPADLFRAQDACLDHCDQFACMKIAQAYKSGAGVPADPLAGRRYALHACLECGSPGLAIVDQCPSWGIEGEPKKKPTK